MDDLASTVDSEVAIRRHIDLIQALAREVGETELLLDAKRKALADAMLNAYDDEVRPIAIYTAAGISRQHFFKQLEQARDRRDKRSA